MHDDGYFDERVADRYDDDPEMFAAETVDPAVEFLAELAGDGRALEFAIGTGRIALPLAQRGVPVHGIDMSEAMVARLRAKPGGEDIGVTIGDFATTTVDGPFSLVYLVYNTIMNLTTQAAQVACFRNAAAHLEPGGCFVIEVDDPRAPAATARRDVPGFPRERDAMGDRRVRRREPGAHVPSLRDRRREVERLAVPFRYAWPAEYDLMASSPRCAFANAGADGSGSRSRARAGNTCRSGRSRPRRSVQRAGVFGFLGFGFFGGSEEANATPRSIHA